MLEVTTKLESGAIARVSERLTLAFELRQKSRLRARLDSGEEAALMMPRGQVLRGGDLLQAGDGRVIEVIAAPEKVLHIECTTPTELARAAYHLGNRHVPVQVGKGFLRIAEDHVLREMLQGLGATVTPMQAPFEPEAGAYGGGHHHHAAGAPAHGAKIHEYVFRTHK